MATSKWAAYAQAWKKYKPRPKKTVKRRRQARRPSQPSRPKPKAKGPRTKKGDNVSKLAANQGVSLSSFLSSNPNLGSGTIAPGQTINSVETAGLTAYKKSQELASAYAGYGFGKDTTPAGLQETHTTGLIPVVQASAAKGGKAVADKDPRLTQGGEEDYYASLAADRQAREEQRLEFGYSDKGATELGPGGAPVDTTGGRGRGAGADFSEQPKPSFLDWLAGNPLNVDFADNYLGRNYEANLRAGDANFPGVNPLVGAVGNLLGVEGSVQAYNEGTAPDPATGLYSNGLQYPTGQYLDTQEANQIAHDTGMSVDEVDRQLNSMEYYANLRGDEFNSEVAMSKLYSNNMGMYWEPDVPFDQQMTMERAVFDPYVSGPEEAQLWLRRDNLQTAMHLSDTLPGTDIEIPAMTPEQQEKISNRQMLNVNRQVDQAIMTYGADNFDAIWNVMPDFYTLEGLQRLAIEWNWEVDDLIAEYGYVVTGDGSIYKKTQVDEDFTIPYEDLYGSGPAYGGGGGGGDYKPDLNRLAHDWRLRIT